MKRNRSVVLVCALVLMTAMLSAQTITEYSLPSSSSSAGNVCSGPDGAIWFMDTGTGSVGRMAVDGRVVEYPVPPSGNDPVNLVGCAFGPDNRLYFGEQNYKKVVAFNPTTHLFKKIALPPPNNAMAGMVFGADGNLWIMVSGSSAIRRMDTTGKFLPIIKLAAGRYPHGPSLCADGNVWFAEVTANRIARITPTGELTEIILPLPGSRPFSTSCGASGVYATLQAVNRIARINYRTLRIVMRRIPTPDSQPTGVAIGRAGVYAAESMTNKIAVMPINAGSIAEYLIPSLSAPNKLALGPDGRVWFSERAPYIGVID